MRVAMMTYELRMDHVAMRVEVGTMLLRYRT